MVCPKGAKMVPFSLQSGNQVLETSFPAKFVRFRYNGCPVCPAELVLFCMEFLAAKLYLCRLWQMTPVSFRRLFRIPKNTVLFFLPVKYTTGLARFMIMASTAAS